MRTRWQEWVIAVALVALGVTGIGTIWGGDLARLFRPADPSVEVTGDPAGEAGAQKPDTQAGPGKPPPPLPSGPLQGPI